MESFLTGRVAKLGLDEEAFVPYLASLASDSESEESLRERLQTALENIGAENFSSFLDEFVAFCEGLSEHEKHRQEQQEIEARSQAEKALLATKVLRGNVETPAVAANKDETPEERKKRLELLARYDVPDEIVMDASGKVLVRDVSEKTQINVDGNDNQERVRQAELEQRARQKIESQKQKELSKTSAFDGKKKKAEAKEKRREKAVKVERKGRGGN